MSQSAVPRVDDTPPPVLFKVPEVAARLNVAENTVHALISTGQLRSVKIGRARRISASALAEYLERIGA